MMNFMKRSLVMVMGSPLLGELLVAGLDDGVQHHDAVGR